MSYSISLFKKPKHQRGHFIGWVNISHKSPKGMLEIKEAKLLSKIRQSWSSADNTSVWKMFLFLGMDSGFVHSSTQQIFTEPLCQALF